MTYSYIYKWGYVIDLSVVGNWQHKILAWDAPSHLSPWPPISTVPFSLAVTIWRAGDEVKRSIWIA